MSSPDLPEKAGHQLAAELERQGVLTQTSIVLPPGISYDRYEALLAMTGELRDSTCWIIGDLLNYGERVYGETYAQASDVTGLAPSTLMNYASVCSRVPRSRRRPPAVLKFSVHAEVAYLPPAEQERWLKEAERNRWKRHHLREALAPYRAKALEPGDGKEAVEVLPPAGESYADPALDEEHICQCPACGRYHRTDVDIREANV